MEPNPTGQSSANAGKEILFSKTIKAGSRIYYIDVKKSSTGDTLMAITESKKVSQADPTLPAAFERHKVFVYQEDLLHFKQAIDEAMAYIGRENLIPQEILRSKQE